MFKHVLIGADEHEGTRDAVALARNLIEPGGALTLAHIHAVTMIGRGGDAVLEAGERERGQQLLQRVVDETGVDAACQSVGASSVGRGLHVLAESVGADLLVLGSTRHSTIGRVLVGDDTRAALNGAPCAVAVAPTGYAQHTSAMREIGVAYNGSPESEHAVRVARRIAAEHGAKLSAFEAVTLPSYAFVGVPAPTDDMIDDLVQEAKERIEALGGIEAHAVYGPAAAEITLYAASLDLLVLGSRDYGPFGRLVHGSTTGQLVHSAPCPVLALTRAARRSGLVDEEPAADEGALNSGTA